MKFIVQIFGASVILALTADSVFAGAWPRGKGNVFVAANAELTWPDGRTIELPDIYGGTYLEFGLSERVTLGLDLGSSDAKRPDRLKSVGFMRYTLTTPDASYQVAIDAGAGGFLGDTVARLGASFGTGFTSFDRQSWVSIDLHTLRSTTSGNHATTLDATYGVSLKRGKIMGQLSGFQAFDRTQSVSFTPSFAYDLGKGRHLEIGVRIGLKEKPDPALKIGIWQEF